MKLEDVTPRIMDKYYRDLLSVKAVSSKYVKARTEYLTPHTVREVHKTLRNAFNQAVKWELMNQKPCGARYAAERRTQDQGYLDSRSAPEGSGSL